MTGMQEPGTGSDAERGNFRGDAKGTGQRGGPTETLRTNAQQGAEAPVVVRKQRNGRGAKGDHYLRTRFTVNRKGRN